MPYLAERTWEIVARGGLVMVPIFLAAQAGWWLVFSKWWYLRRAAFPARAFWAAAPAEPEALARFARESRLSRGIFGILAERVSAARGLGEAAMVYAAKEALEEHGPRLQRHLPTVSILAAIAPLLGLLGTISGIMATFKVITLYGAGNPAMLAGGIGEALIATEAGLVTAFPLLLCHNYLMNRADAVENALIAGATRLIRIYRGEAAREDKP